MGVPLGADHPPGGCPQQPRQVVNNDRPVTATPGKGATTCIETAAGSSQSSAPLCGALRYQSHTGAINASRTPYKRGFNRGTPGGQPYGPGVTPLASPSPCRFAADNASHRRPSSHHVLDSPQSNGTVCLPHSPPSSCCCYPACVCLPAE